MIQVCKITVVSGIACDFITHYYS